MIDGSSLFETVPSEGCRCNSIHSFDEERRKLDIGMKGIKRRRKEIEGCRYEKMILH
jgi:hypothetical protein